MNRIKAWLRGWLGAVQKKDIAAFCDDDKYQLRGEFNASIAALHAEHDAAIAQLIMDINGIRNQIPAATAQATNSKVRVIRNFGEFKAAIEVTPQRKSQ